MTILLLEIPPLWRDARFHWLIFRGSGCVYAICVPFYAYRADGSLIRRPFAPG